MSGVKDLTVEDMEGVVITSHNRFDILAATAQRALQLLQQHEAAQRQETKMRTTRRKRDRRSTEYADGEGEPYAAKRKKQNTRKNKKKANTRKNKKKPVDDGPRPRPPPSPPPRLPERFKNVIREISEGRIVSEETLVIQKALFPTDLNPSHNRLSMPFTQISHHGFLTDEEKKFLCCRDGKGKKEHKDVPLIEPSLKKTTVTLGRWDMPKEKGKTSSTYVINGTWTSIVTGNQLKVEMVIQLWAVRIGEELCFALVNLTEEAAA
ncbi:UNVERIFIED_CONTAM: B3 domain-containing protein [Sesamum latifolium]|uniref:B3 domain-containing protein n=1 Tax=Sesamum latifolium TaxID=2727402 RepID=A0AAW2WNF9_9LAMI